MPTKHSQNLDSLIEKKIENLLSSAIDRKLHGVDLSKWASSIGQSYHRQSIKSLISNNDNNPLGNSDYQIMYQLTQRFLHPFHGQ